MGTGRDGALMDVMTNRPLAIYVHWPWCKAKCPYCDFNSHASTPHEPAYVNGLLKELTLWREQGVIPGVKTLPFGAPERPVASVFFGGGTPSLMRPESIRQVIEGCREMGLFSDQTEVTLECNPTSFGDSRKALDFFDNLRSSGVNRISVGIQGLEPDWLAFLGRQHRVEDALATLDAAQQVFDNVNADVIYGLPDQDLTAWGRQLETLSQRGLTHISAYQLTIEKNTRFYSDVRRGLWNPISSDAEADFFEATRHILRQNGYENYEISNFAKPGKACQHNLHVWRYGDYLGIGAGAHGRLTLSDGRTVATQVARQPDAYLRRMETGETPLAQAFALHPAEATQEAIFSGLRLAEGVCMETLSKRFQISTHKDPVSGDDVTLLAGKGLLDVSTGRLRLSDSGWAKLDAVLSRILSPLGPDETPTSLLASTPPTVHNHFPTVVIE